MTCAECKQPSEKPLCDNCLKKYIALGKIIVILNEYWKSKGVEG